MGKAKGKISPDPFSGERDSMRAINGYPTSRDRNRSKMMRGSGNDYMRLRQVEIELPE